MFKQPFTLHFDQADPSGNIMFAQAPFLCHRQLESFLPSINIDWQKWFASDEWAVPIRAFAVEFFSPLKAGQRGVAKTTINHIGHSSVEFHFHFTTADGSVFFQAKSTHVFVDRETEKKRPVPDALRDRLTKACQKTPTDSPF